MKIALVVPGGVDVSGEYRVIPAVLALITRLSTVHEVHVFALKQEHEPGTWNLCGARVYNIGVRRTIVRGVRELIREHRRSPFALVHSLWSGASGLIAVIVAKSLRLPCLIHLTGGELVALKDIGYGGALSWHGPLRERVVLRLADIVTATSELIRSEIAMIGIHARRIPLGVDLTVWRSSEPARRSMKEPARLVHIASINRVKDQTTLLRAIALVRHEAALHLDIVGEDTLAGAMQRLSRELHLEREVTFHGFLPQRLVHPIVAAAHVNIVSSRHEAGPYVALEAAALGVPTVGTAVGHIAEWAPDAAVAVPTNDPHRLAQGILSLLSNEEERLRMATAARRRAIAEDADFTAREFLKCYEELVRGNQASARNASRTE